MDPSEDGHVTCHELHNFLYKDLKIETTLDECTDIINRYDFDGNGRMEYSEFLRLMNNESPVHKAKHVNFDVSAKESTIDILLGKIKRSISRELKSGESIASIFADIDSDGSGS